MRVRWYRSGDRRRHLLATGPFAACRTSRTTSVPPTRRSPRAPELALGRNRRPASRVARRRTATRCFDSSFARAACGAISRSRATRGRTLTATRSSRRSRLSTRSCESAPNTRRRRTAARVAGVRACRSRYRAESPRRRRARAKTTLARHPSTRMPSARESGFTGTHARRSKTAAPSASAYGTAFHLALEDFHGEFPRPTRARRIRRCGGAFAECVTWAFERNRDGFDTPVEFELQARRAQRTAQRYVDWLLAAGTRGAVRSSRTRSRRRARSGRVSRSSDTSIASIATSARAGSASSTTRPAASHQRRRVSRRRFGASRLSASVLLLGANGRGRSRDPAGR